VLRDVISNVIEIVEHAEHCLRSCQRQQGSYLVLPEGRLA